MSSLIEVAGLVVEYPGLRALDQVSFTLEAGTITALVGPNGAGKTTLMRCLCGLDRPLEGRILLAGFDVMEAPRECHARLGFLPDFLGLYDALTVAQCLQYAAAAHAIRLEIPSRITTTAARLALTPYLSQPVGTLSRGLRQRVAIGQAIIHSPKMLILDEPASGLDPEARHALAQLFHTLQAEGMTLLVSSHILAELEDYATHMLILRAGQLIEHRALGSAPAHTMLIIEFAQGQPAGLAWLAAQPAVSELVTTGATVRCLFAGDAAAQATLLHALLLAGAGVVRFGPAGADLQQSYLETVRHGQVPLS